jgi:hypothetical protein
MWCERRYRKGDQVGKQIVGGLFFIKTKAVLPFVFIKMKAARVTKAEQRQRW